MIHQGGYVFIAVNLLGQDNTKTTDPVLLKLGRTVHCGPRGIILTFEVDAIKEVDQERFFSFFGRHALSVALVVKKKQRIGLRVSPL